jgi:hypothetical protein
MDGRTSVRKVGHHTRRGKWNQNGHGFRAYIASSFKQGPKPEFFEVMRAEAVQERNTELDV